MNWLPLSECLVPKNSMNFAFALENTHKSCTTREVYSAKSNHQNGNELMLVCRQLMRKPSTKAIISEKGNNIKSIRSIFDDEATK